MTEQKLEEANLLSWNSTIDNRFSIFIIYPNHPAFKQLEGIYFKIFGVAFLDFETMTIFIDGKELSKDGYTINHLYAIEAHEIAHHILQHDRKRPTKDQEREADAAAIVILDYLNHNAAKELLITRFKGLYTDDYSIDNNLPKKEHKMLIDYLKNKKPSLLNKIKDKIKEIFRINKK